MSRSAALIIGKLTLKVRYRSTASVSTQLDEGPVAEVLKDEFTHKQPQRDTVDIAAQLVNKVEEHSARFLMYVAEKIARDQSTHTHTTLLLNIFKHFASTYLATKDIHSLTSTFDTDTRKTILSAYFFALAAVKAREINLQFQSKNPPFLLLVCPKSLPFLPCLVVNEIYFDKLQNQYDTFVASFVHWQTLRKLPLPAVTYLTLIPISFPLIGLNQLVQYLVICHVANLTPGELRSRLSGAMDHSQDIVFAITIAASGTFEEFADNSHKAIKWLSYSRLRGQ
jgi:fatty acid synthase subunit beta